MGLRKLTRYEIHALASANVEPSRQTRCSNVYTRDQIDTAVKQLRAVQQEKQQAAMKEDSAYFTSPEFRQDVIDELMSRGKNLEQATNLTRDQARLFAMAREVGLM